jgi:hypothetical protein
MRTWLILLLTMFVVPSSVFATDNGLSEKQVRAIVKKEVAKIRPGKDGVPILSAHIFGTGRVDDTTPGGITQENVRRMDNPVAYCFSGLPPVVGGQVTLDGVVSAPAGVTPYISMTTDCNPEVLIAGPNGFQAADFYVLLY